jgi:hypothetical protein
MKLGSLLNYMNYPCGLAAVKKVIPCVRIYHSFNVEICVGPK